MCYNNNRLSFIYLFTVIYGSLNFQCYGQNLDTIFKNYIKIENIKIDSIVRFNSETDKLKYLSVLPNFSYNANQNKFGIGISLSNLSTYYQAKKRNQIELQKLYFQLNEIKNSSIEKFTKEYEQIIDAYEILRLELDNKKLSEEIFNLKKSQYENNKITLETWLMIQDNYQKTNIIIIGKCRNIISKMKQFELKIKNSCFDQEFKYLSINVPNQ